MGTATSECLINDFGALPASSRRALRNEYLALLDDGISVDDVFFGLETTLVELIQARLHELKAQSGRLLELSSNDDEHFFPSPAPSRAVSRNETKKHAYPETAVREPLLPPIVTTSAAAARPALWAVPYVDEIEVRFLIHQKKKHITLFLTPRLGVYRS